jgi:hypothetical protein
MDWVKSGAVGALGSLVIFIVMILGVQVTGFAPFNLPPSAAFLTALGIPAKPLAVVAHFGYGIAWALILFAVFRDRVNLANGIGLATVQWLIMMLIYSPIIGWGLFGVGGPGHALPANAPLHLGSPVKYIVMTLVLHLIYGALNGWLIPRWVERPRTGEAA